MQRIHAQLLERGKLSMLELFQPHSHRSTLVGLFLATLELVRHHGVHLEQGELFEEIWILPGETTAESLKVTTVEDEKAIDTSDAAGAKKTAKRASKGGRRKAEGGKGDEPGSI